MNRHAVPNATLGYPGSPKNGGSNPRFYDFDDGVTRRVKWGPSNPADEHLARQMFRDHVELKQIEHGVLLGCGRRYVALLNGTAVGPIAGLKYFSSTIREVQALQASKDNWRHLALGVARFEQQWASRRR